ncbi:MAG: D-glycero-beta-D-manno-heptose-7-phosphate kinase [Candidatus Adiutrix sp.]
MNFINMKVLELLDKIAKVPILCVGDIMIDRYIYGSATRISPEAPVPVVRVKKHVLVPGGVGNVTTNLGALGANPSTVTVAGEDQDALIVSQLLTRAKVSPPHLIQDPQRPTSVKTRIIAGIQQLVRFDEEETHPLSGEVAKKFVAVIRREMKNVGAVTISDYGKGVLTAEILKEILTIAEKAHIPVVVDPKGANYELYRGATLVTPNRAELAYAFGQTLVSEQDEEIAGRTLMAKHGLANILITRSEDGMMLLKANDPQAFLMPSQARAVFDVSGAGDTVVAVMGAALALNAPLELGAQLANLAAGVVVGKVGTATATPDEIRTYHQRS